MSTRCRAHRRATSAPAAATTTARARRGGCWQRAGGGGGGGGRGGAPRGGGGGGERGVLLAERGGTGAGGVKATLPAGAGGGPVAFRSVSCPSAGNCGAVGVYRDGAGHFQGVLLTESAGTWVAGVEATLPAGAATDPSVSLPSVSCASAGNCSAAGSYIDSAGNRQGVLFSTLRPPT